MRIALALFTLSIEFLAHEVSRLLAWFKIVLSPCVLHDDLQNVLFILLKLSFELLLISLPLILPGQAFFLLNLLFLSLFLLPLF